MHYLVGWGGLAVDLATLAPVQAAAASNQHVASGFDTYTFFSVAKLLRLAPVLVSISARARRSLPMYAHYEAARLALILLVTAHWLGCMWLVVISAPPEDEVACPPKIDVHYAMRHVARLLSSIWLLLWSPRRPRRRWWHTTRGNSQLTMRCSKCQVMKTTGGTRLKSVLAHVCRRRMPCGWTATGREWSGPRTTGRCTYARSTGLSRPSPPSDSATSPRNLVERGRGELWQSSSGGLRPTPRT